MKQPRVLGLCYAAIVAAVVVVAGCSGGGGSAPTNVSPGATPAPGPQSTAFKQYAQAILSFPKSTPPGIRNYVSPNSTSVSVTVNAVNGLPPPSWVPPQEIIALSFSGSNRNCTLSNGLATCTVTVPAPPGNVDYIIATYAVVATPNPSPSPSVSPTPIVPAILDYNEETVAIKQGVANGGPASPISITLKGVVKSASVALTQPLVAGVPSTSQLTVQAYDASGAPITGNKPYDSPFQLTDADPHLKNQFLAPYATSISVNGLPAGKTVQISSPADAVTIKYGGLASGQFNMIGTGTGRAGSWNAQSTITPTLAPIFLPGTFIDDTAHGGLPSDPNYNQNTLLVPLNTTVSITPSEVGFTNSPYGICQGPKGPTVTCLGLQSDIQIYTGCNAPTNSVANFSPAPPGQLNGYMYTVTGKKAGLCLEQFVDALAPGHDPAPNGNPLDNGEIWVKVQ